MPAVSFAEEPHVDPDDLKMPERAVHRQAVDLIALAATHLLGSEARIFRDLNWYPDDGGSHVAPDLMVIRADAIEALPKSYRQDRTGGPPPSVVVEIPSESDTFVSLRTKAIRYQRIGTAVYVVIVDDGELDVLRLGLDDREFRSWAGQPIPELGSLRLHFQHGLLTAALPDGTSATSDANLLVTARWAEEVARQAEMDARDAEQAARDAEQAARDAERAARQAAQEARRKAEALEAQLRALGVEPNTS